MARDLDIDSEMLISLVKARPVLWDKTMDTYKDRSETKKAWMEIFTILKSDYGELEDIEKNKFGKEIIKKWGNIRDAFTKACKKEKRILRSGEDISTIKKYIYSDQLQFLSKVIRQRTIHDIALINTKICEGDIPPESLQEGNFQEVKTEHAAAGSTFKKPKKELLSRKRKLEEVDVKRLQPLDLLDRHLSFFKGIIPSLQSFSEDEVLQFQMGVLHLITNIKQQKSVDYTDL